MITGYLSQGVIANLKIMAGKPDLDTAMLNDLITSFLASPQFRTMRDGENYYNYQHDILKAVTNQYYVDGVLQTDKVAANNKLPNPFHTILLNQKAAYICGNPVVIAVSDTETDPSSAEFNDSLVMVLDESFDDMLNDWVINAGNHGVDWMHFYIDPVGDLQKVLCPATQCIPIFDTQYETKLIAMIRFYQVDEVVNGKAAKIYKVEKWDAQKKTFWTQIEEGGSFYLDAYYGQNNPMGHWTAYNDSLKTEEPQGWGRVPFVPLPNNSQWKTDLEPINPLIDAYDKVVSGWCNDLEDFAEQILIVKGFTGIKGEVQSGMSQLQLLMHNLKHDRAIGVDDEGTVDNLKIEIPVEAKEKFLTLTRKAIFYFGEGVDTNDEKIGNAPSGIALKFLYTGLDLKANRLIRKLKTALKEVIWFVTEYINCKEGKSYQSDQVIYTINKSQIFNEKEKIDGLVASKEMLSEQTILENHPYVDDVQEELSRLKTQREEKQKTVKTPEEIQLEAQRNLMNNGKKQTTALSIGAE